LEAATSPRKAAVTAPERGDPETLSAAGGVDWSMSTRRMRRRRALALPAGMALVAGAGPAGAQGVRQDPGQPPARLLVVTATAGFVHDSIPAAREIVARLGQESGAFSVTFIPDVAALTRLTAETLAAHDAVFFLNTSGELPLDGDQKRALLEFVAGGGGYLGAHAASDTLYTWPEYGELVGAVFKEHPWTQRVTITVEDEGHPLTAGLGTGFDLTEEIYTFRANPRLREGTSVLLRLDPASVGIRGGGGVGGGGGQGNGEESDFPLSWCAPYGAGRSFYTALGHFVEVWQDERVQRHLLAAVRWATGR
jgi:type 1 glutamine amidotransferase